MRCSEPRQVAEHVLRRELDAPDGVRTISSQRGTIGPKSIPSGTAFTFSSVMPSGISP
jgi:hypothetical protein